MAKGYPVISGRIGPLVVCHIKKDNSIRYRARPRKYKQTSATVAAQTPFGISARAGKILRRKLVSIMPFPKDKLMQSRFSGVMNKWLNDNATADRQPVNPVPHVSTFAFNEACPLQRRWSIPVSISSDAAGKFFLELPPFIPSETISAPAGTFSVECRIAAAACMLGEGTDAGHFQTILTFPFNAEEIPAQQINTNIERKPGSLIVCGAFLVFYLQTKSRKIATANVKFMPAGLFAAIYC